MASRDPRVGGNVLIQFRDAVISGVRSAFATGAIKSVQKYRGPFSPDVLKNFATKAPAIVVCFEGTEELEDKSGTIGVPVMMSVALITKPRQDGDHDDPNAAMAERLLRLVARNTWGLVDSNGDPIADAPVNIASRNAFVPKYGTSGVNVWLVKWLQNVDISLLSDEELSDLSDLEQIFGTYTQDNDAAPQHERSSDYPNNE